MERNHMVLVRGNGWG